MTATCKLQIIFMMLVSGAMGADPQDQSLMIQTGHIQTKGNTKQESPATASMPVPQSECLNIQGTYSYSDSGWPKFKFEQKEGECTAKCEFQNTIHKKEDQPWMKCVIGSKYKKGCISLTIAGNDAVCLHDNNGKETSQTTAKIYKQGERTVIVWEPTYGWTFWQEVPASQMLPPPTSQASELPVSSDRVYAHYRAEDWDDAAQKLPNRGKGATHAVVTEWNTGSKGRKIRQYTDGAGWRGNEYPITYIGDAGAASDKIAELDFGAVFQENNDKYTICSLTRATGPDTWTNRIIQGEHNNWAHGHYDGMGAGVAIYGSWVGWAKGGRVHPPVNWVSLCAHNGPGEKDLVLNGEAIPVTGGSGYAVPKKLMINHGGAKGSDTPFAFAMLVTFTDYLSTDEMQAMSKYMLEALAAPATTTTTTAAASTPGSNQNQLTITISWDPDNIPTNVTVQPTDIIIQKR